MRPSWRPPLILPAKIAEIVEKTTREAPEGGTQLSTCRLAHAAGVSPSAVGRVWRAHGKRISMT
jgi:DNA-binding MurR/RpiR family transcriptional regulator